MAGVDKVRVGIIGCGKIAATHALALSRLAEADLVACCDRSEERARALAAEHGAPHVFADAGELLGSGLVDAVHVCTPHPDHAAVVTAAAGAGVHVLCEKPIAVTLAEADRMIGAAERAGVKLGVVFQRRFWPAAQRIRRLLDEGRLGRPTLAECAVRIWRSPEYFAADPWRGRWATEGGGVLMNQAVHALDLFQWFMGPAVEVSGRYATLRHAGLIDVEDTAVAAVRFASGALGTVLAASTVAPGFGYRVAVHGDRGATVSVWERQEGEQGINDVWTLPGEEAARAAWEREEAGQPGFPRFHIEQIHDFLCAVRDDRPPAVTGRDARHSLELILAIYRSSRRGAPVPLPLAADPPALAR